MKDKFLITGVSGFVSRHFVRHLETNNIAAHLLGVDVSPCDLVSSHADIDIECRVLNLLEDASVTEVISNFRPDYILHLASYSSVAYSWGNPVTSFSNNTNIFLNILDAVRQCGLQCRILSIGSSEEYGNVSPVDVPLREDHRLRPVSPYAVARVSQELLSQVYHSGYGLDLVMTRSFNHIGCGQKDIFVIASFVKQLCDAKQRGDEHCTLRTGDTSIVRDFLDVRDVVNAYYCLLQRGRPGETYNICSGTGHSLKSIIDMLSDLVQIKVHVEVDSALIRPNDNKIIVGSRDKITKELEWAPKIPLEESLKDMIRQQQSAAADASQE